MKKKLTLVIVAIVLVAAIAVGGSLAYFTATDKADNTFTMGDVKIDLLETVRDGSAYVDNQKLLPIVGSAQGAVDQYGYPVAANYIDKTVDVENTGSEDAYVRVIYAFPAGMDDAQSAAEMMLHWNYFGSEPAGTWTRIDQGVQVTIDGQQYNLYTNTYNAVLAAGNTTAWPSLTGVYLDARVNATVNADGDVTYSMVNGRGDTVSTTFVKGTSPKILVFAQAIQADGFADAAAAFTASGLPTNPWA